MPLSQPNFGHDLYRILPEVYRNRDHSGDLAAYLDACGTLLDRIHATLLQKLADQFPDNPAGGTVGPDHGRAAQDWLLPYFADLLDARLDSPLVEGRRDEIAKAISWRQRKGTLAVIEQIVESISQQEAVVQEGWTRVAITPRLGKPLLPAVSHGYDGEPHPGLAARHPGLPAATRDFRCPSGAVATPETNAGAQTATVAGVARRWRQASVHGAPCHPGSYEDPSRRTVDLRDPDWRLGHAHPRRILLFVPPPAGHFADGHPTVVFDPDALSQRFHELIEVDESEPGLTIYRNRTFATPDFLPVALRRNVTLQPPGTGEHRYRFEGLLLQNTVTLDGVRLELVQGAVRNVVSNLADLAAPVVDALDSLCETIAAPDGLVRLEACTVLGGTTAAALQASDCIFLEPVVDATGAAAPPGCLRFSRIPPAQDTATLSTHRNTTRQAVFFSSDFDTRGAGVLHPASDEAVCHGAEDGGEMGAHHHQHHCQIRAAIARKLADYLPLGFSAVLIPDSRLLEAPVPTDS